MFKKIAKILLYLLGSFVYIISLFVPKDRNLWVFGSWFGSKFADNPKYLFLYVKKFHPEIHAVWFTRNDEVYDYLVKNKFEVYRIGSLIGLWYILRSGCIIISTNANDVLGGVSKFVRVRIIQLWHGTPLKRLRMVSNYSRVLVNFAKRLFPFYGRSYSLVIATSVMSKKSMAIALNVDEKKVVVTGYPRNDVFFDDWLKKPKCLFLEDIRENINFKKVIAYLPTCRGTGPNVKVDLLEKYKFNILQWEQILERIDGIMIMKPHYYNMFGVKDKTGNSKRVLVASDKEIPDIYEFLPYVDILITDYSSVYFDFLLLDKPIIFAPFDIEEYTRTTTGFFYEYNEVAPGCKAKNWNDIADCIMEIYEGNDKYSYERKKISALFNEYSDGNSSLRVFNTILSLLNGGGNN